MNIFSTDHPEYLAHLFNFLGNEGAMAAIKIERTEIGGRLTATNTYCMGVFYDDCFISPQSINLYLTKDHCKILRKGRKVWLKENGNLTVQIQKDHQELTFKVDYKERETFFDVDTILTYKDKIQPINSIDLNLDYITKFKFGKNNTLRLYSTGSEGPIYVKNTKYKNFEGFIMPVIIND